MSNAIPRSGYDLAAKILETHPDDAIETMLKYSNGAECDWLEFKAGMTLRPEDVEKENRPDDLYWDYVLSIVAMANTRGGAFVIGVRDSDHEPVPLESCDPRHIIQQRGKEAYLREEIVDKFDRPDRKWTTKDGTVWGLPTSIVPFIDARIIPYRESEAVVILVSPDKPGEELFVSRRIRGGDEYEDLPIRKKGEVGRVKRLTKRTDCYAYVSSRKVESDQFGVWWDNFEAERHAVHLPLDVLYGHNFREKLFIGRDAALADLREKMKETGIVVIRGAAGNGKTSIAERIANDWCANESGHAFWIDAEHLQDWEMIFGAVEQLDFRILPWLEEKVASRTEPEESIGHRVAKGLEKKCGTGFHILLVLDNVETTEIFSDGQIQEWFPNRIPPQLHILATSRFDATGTHVEDPVFQYNLGYLPLSAARELLVSVLKDARGSDLNEKDLSDDERKALDDLVALTHGHAWTIKVIGGFMAKTYATDDVFTAPMSFGAALELYEKQGLSEFSPDDPLLLKKFLAPTLDRIRQRRKDGAALFDLARFAALVARDGVSETHLLRAFWKKTTKGSETSFKRALGTLVGCSLFDPRSETAIEMHRNTQDVLREEIDSVFRDCAGSFLSTYPGLELRHWSELLQNGVPSDFCPVRLLSFRTLQRVLSLDWSLLKPDMVSAFSAPEMCWLLENGPEEILDFPWLWRKLEEIHPNRDYAYGIPGCCTYRYPKGPRGSFCPSYWTEVLSKIPSLVRHCNLSSLSHDDLGVIVQKHPSIMDEHSFFKNNPKGLPHYLIAHPESISEQCLSLLDPEGWRFLTDMMPRLRKRMPAPIRSLLARIEQVRNAREKEREEIEAEDRGGEEFDEADSWWEEANNLSQLYGVDLLSKEEFLKSDDGRAMAVYLALSPEDASLRLLNPLGPDDWAILYAERPEFIEEFGSDKLNGATPEGWTAALSRNSDLIHACQAEFDQAGGMNMFSGDQLIDIVTRTPRLLKRCKKEQFSGANWATLVQRFPSLADYCPWNWFVPKEYAQLLVHHPEWAKRYQLSFDGLDDLQWAQLLSCNPEFRKQCHCRFTERAAKELVSAIKSDPTILDALSEETEKSFFDPLLLFSRQKNDELPWISLVAPNPFHYYGSYKKLDDKTDFYFEWTKRLLPIKWESLNSSDWKQLLLKHPDCRDAFQREQAWKCVSGDDWRYILNDSPWFYEFCDWRKLSVDNWISLLGKHSSSHGFIYGFNEQRQLSVFLPSDFGTAELLNIFSSLPWLEQALPVDHPARERLNRERNRFTENLLSGRTVIDLKPEEFSWPHHALAKFSSNMKCFDENEQLKLLASELDHTYCPQNASKTLSLLSSMIFDNQDLSEEEVCHLERRILFALVRRELWDEATLVLNRLPDVVEKAKEFPVDEKHADLSSAISDGFACFCRGEILWAKGNYDAAALAFKSARSSSRSFEALFSNPGMASLRNWDGRLRPPKPDSGRPSFSDLQVELALSDCENRIPREQSTYYWAKKLQVNLEHPKPSYGLAI